MMKLLFTLGDITKISPSTIRTTCSLERPPVNVLLWMEQGVSQRILMQLGHLQMPMGFRKSPYLLTAGNYSLIGRNKFLHVGLMLDLQTIRYSTVHIGLEELSQIQTMLTQMVGFKTQVQKRVYMMV